MSEERSRKNDLTQVEAYLRALSLASVPDEKKQWYVRTDAVRILLTVMYGKQWLPQGTGFKTGQGIASIAAWIFDRP